tara:strand:+ start:872 stop:1501 length:630 start_codon:yes stop_codon:yes gene_type:complete
MSRDIPFELQASISDDVVHPFFAIELFFDTETLRFWSGIGELVYNDDTYVGSGDMIAVTSINETSEISAQGARITLSALPSEMLSLVLSEPYQGRKCYIYFGLLINGEQRMLQQSGDFVLQQDNGHIIVGEADLNDTVTQIFSGYIDQMNIDEGPQNSQITVAVENRLIDLQRSRIKRYTNQSQMSRFPDDKGFEFVESMQDKKFAWGR